MNTMFARKPDPADGKFKDFLTIVYKDLDTGQKHVEEIVNPNYEYYIVHEEARKPYPRLFVDKKDVDMITVPYSQLEKDIAKRTGLTEFFYTNINNGNRSENKKLHTHPDVFNSDTNIEDHYRFRFGKLYRNETCSVSKSFFDIEVDGIDIEGDFPMMGECPINAITLILQSQQLVFTYLLRTKANPQIAEFEASVRDGSVFPELTEFVIQAVGGPDVAAKYGIDFRYNFLFYNEEDEINLIHDLFKAINYYQPDFALAWNMAFDIPFIIERIKALGYDPRNIMCNDDFEYKFAEYYIDERNKNDFAERGDFAQISSYTTYLDQMIHFASRRKGQSKFISFNLDYIGEAVAKVRKLDYKHITTDIAQLPYKSFKTFVFYNIMDTIVQYCIEAVTGDIDYIFNKCLTNNTRYSKGHRQTVYLTNRACKDFYNMDDGYILGNNHNKYNQKPDTKFPGAFVADPLQLNDYSKMKLNGIPINVFNNLIDMDYASLYPSIIREFFIAAYTQIGKIIINGDVANVENKRKLDTWTKESAFMEDYQSHMWLEMCHRWFNLSDYTTLYHEVIDFFTNICEPYFGLRTYERDGSIIPFEVRKESMFKFPFIVENNSMRAINDRYYRPNINAWEVWRNDRIANPNQQF